MVLISSFCLRIDYVLSIGAEWMMMVIRVQTVGWLGAMCGRGIHVVVVVKVKTVVRLGAICSRAGL